MIGVLVTSYGDLPGALVTTAEAILGKQTAFESVSVKPSECREEIVGHLQSAVARLSQPSEGVLILTGIYGESNCRLCESLFAGQTIRIITGVNLPMLFKVLTYRNSLSLDELAKRACQGGKEGIRLITPPAEVSA